MTKKKEQKEYLTQTAFAKLVGVTQPIVSRAIKSGRLEKCVVNGKIDKKIGLIEWENNKDTSKIRDGTEDPRLAMSRARKEAAIAELKEIELQEKKGELVHVKDVHEAWFKTSRACRDRILKMPIALAPLLAGKKNIKRIEAIIRDYLQDALEDFRYDIEE